MIDSLLGLYSAGAEFEVGNASLVGQKQCSLSPQANELLVSWTSGDRIYARSFTQMGVAITAPVSVADMGEYSTAISIQNRSLIVWQGHSQTTQSNEIFGRILNNNLTHFRGENFQVNTHTAFSQERPQPLALDDGFVIVYASGAFNGFTWALAAQLYDSISRPRGEEFRINNNRSIHTLLPRGIARLGTGFVPVWLDHGNDGDGHGVFARAFDAMGAPLGSDLLVNNVTERSQTEPDIASWAGRLFVIWQSHVQDGDGWGIFGQLLNDRLESIGPEFQINTQTILAQSNPRVIATESLFVTSWNSNHNGKDHDIYLRGYTHQGDPLGPETKVNHVTAGDQRFPCLTAVGQGFAVAWGDEKRDGIFARVFTETRPTVAISTLVASSTLSSHVSLATSMGTIAVGTAFSPSDSTNTTTIALVSIIVGLLLSLAGSLIVHFYDRRRRTEFSEENKSQHGGLPLTRKQEEESHYQSVLPVQMRSTPADYDSFRVVEEENTYRNQEGD